MWCRLVAFGCDGKRDIGGLCLLCNRPNDNTIVGWVCRYFFSVVIGKSGLLILVVSHFVPNLTIGAPVVKWIRKAVPDTMYLDCHLMVSNPRQWIKDFQAAGADGYTLHIEAVEESDIEATLKEIRDANMRVGVAVKPKTDLTRVIPLLEKGLVDMVLVMTVEPGFGGQSFMEDMMPKVKVRGNNSM